MAYRFHVILQGLFVDRQPTKNQIGFTKRQRIAFNGIGIIHVLDCELFVESLQFPFRQRSSSIQLLFFKVNLR